MGVLFFVYRCLQTFLSRFSQQLSPGISAMCPFFDLIFFLKRKLHLDLLGHVTKLSPLSPYILHFIVQISLLIIFAIPSPTDTHISSIKFLDVFLLFSFFYLTWRYLFSTLPQAGLDLRINHPGTFTCLLHLAMGGGVADGL